MGKAAKCKITYEEDMAAHQIKRAKTKAALEAIILYQAKVVGKQARLRLKSNGEVVTTGPVTEFLEARP